MKLRIEIDPDMPEEIIIRAHSENDEVRRLSSAVERTLGGSEISVRKGDRERYISCDAILYFETGDNRVWAHTADDIYCVSMRLTELMNMLPRIFARASKSCLVNTTHICSIRRFPTGIAVAEFTGAGKTVYISRMYYKNVRDTIEETRLKQ